MAEIAVPKQEQKTSDSFDLLCAIGEELFAGSVTRIGPDSLLINGWLPAAAKSESKHLISDLKQGPFGIEGLVMQR